MDPIMNIKDLSKNFGGILACKDLTFNVEGGKIKGIIGPNGAGKTTVFNLITGVYSPTSGQIIFRGEDISGKKPHNIVAKGIARTFQNIRLFNNLSLLENVKIALDQKNSKYNFFDAIVRMPRVKKNEAELQQQAMEYLKIVGLQDKAKNRADSLSYGMQRKLEIARSLALEPRVLLLDEPAAGMNDGETFELADLIRKIKEMFNLTVIMIEHHMDLVMELCDHITVMNFGELLAEGTPEEIQSDPEVIRAYLGEGYKNA